MQKFIAFLAFFLISLSFLSAQEEISREEIIVSEESAPFEQKKSSFPKIDSSLFFTFGPKLMLNTDDHTKSAPSPVMYSLGIGGDFLFPHDVLLEAHASFFTNYYLWDGERAQPAEVENRTATALSAMIDLTGGCSWNTGKSQKNFFSASGGLGIFVRHGILSNGVNPDDENRDTKTKASDDVSSINDSFFNDLNFLYPELAFSYSYILSEIWKIGGEARAYIPLGSLMNGNGVDGMIFSLALKLSHK